MRYARKLDARWASAIAIPGPRGRGKEILRIIKEVEAAMNIMDKLKQDDDEIGDALVVMERWHRRHWRGRR